MADNAELTVRDVMRREVPVAGPSATIAELARMMVEHRVPGVPIVSDGELVGIVTEADLIKLSDLGFPLGQGMLFGAPKLAKAA